MEQHELPAPLHTPIQCCWTPLKSSLWPHGCLPSPLQRGWKQRRFSQHGPNAESSFGEDCQGEVREETQGHYMGPGDHRLCLFGRGTRLLLDCQRHLLVVSVL